MVPHLQDRTPSQLTLDSILVSADRVHRLMAMLVDVLPGLDSNLPLMESAIQCLATATILSQEADPVHSGLTPLRFISGERGRPRLLVSQAVLEYLIGNRFTVRQIAQLLQVSPSTIRRQMNHFGITIRSTYSTISDQDLDSIVLRLQMQHPNSGYRLIRGYLAAMGYRIQSIRDSLRRVDSVGIPK